MTTLGLLSLAAATPLAVFLLLLFLGRKLGRAAGYVATAAALVSFGLSVYAMVGWLGGLGLGERHVIEARSYHWINLDQTATRNATSDYISPLPSLPAGPGSFLSDVERGAYKGLQVGVFADSSTILLFVTITLVSTLVHVFSLGYMANDPRFPRFFCYLGLFLFAMLALVLSNSLVQLFAFWELVGLSSYLLIAFWYEKPAAARAGLKAVIVNRIGDAAFLLGLGVLFMHVGPAGLTLYNDAGSPMLVEQILANIGGGGGGGGGAGSYDILHFTTTAERFWGFNWLTWAGILLFVGAMAKSAQFPLHVWLPDAMEGPTPVSALIHAATMVAAGVFLVARIFPILTLDARLFIAMIGCFTLLIGALIAVCATDVKRILAYSTISQLGYMMLFLGCGGFVAGLFHLITHAFFKAMLFLAAGSVIHNLNGRQDIRRMGGLFKRLPITAAAFLVGVLAISGTPFLSGFYSKEMGLRVVADYAYAVGSWGKLLLWIPLVTTYLTAFYMWRCWWAVFVMKPHDPELADSAHENPLMTLPLLILVAATVLVGQPMIGLEKLIDPPPFSDTAVPNAYVITEHTPAVMKTIMEGQTYLNHYGWGFAGGLILALLIYSHGFKVADRLRRIVGVNVVYIWLKNAMYFDYVYEGIVVGLVRLLALLSRLLDHSGIDGLVRGLVKGTQRLSAAGGWADARLVDGAVLAVARGAKSAGELVTLPQNGRLRVYVLGMLAVVVLGLVGLAMTR